jgi:GT2 family glycosyltransferase
LRLIVIPMKISIITATYNSAAHIAGCLASVNNQTRQVNHAGQARHTMTQSHGMTNSKQNLKKIIPRRLLSK